MQVVLPGGCGEGLTASGWRHRATRVAATLPGLTGLGARQRREACHGRCCTAPVARLPVHLRPVSVPSAVADPWVRRADGLGGPAFAGGPVGCPSLGQPCALLNIYPAPDLAALLPMVGLPRQSRHPGPRAKGVSPSPRAPVSSSPEIRRVVASPCPSCLCSRPMSVACRDSSVPVTATPYYSTRRWYQLSRSKWIVV